MDRRRAFRNVRGQRVFRLKILLDTNAFIWASREPQLLSSAAKRAILSERNECSVSLASIWEMQIKQSLGKLPLPGSIDLVALAWSQTLMAKILPIRLSHISRIGRLAPIHKDPFDRMIVAQALAEGMVVVSSDAVFERYSVKVLW